MAELERASNREGSEVGEWHELWHDLIRRAHKTGIVWDTSDPRWNMQHPTTEGTFGKTMAKQVVHVRPADPGSGSDVERYELDLARWRAGAYTVGPAPADDAEHSYGTPCPTCNTAIEK